MLSPCGSKLFVIMFHFDTAAYMSKMLVMLVVFATFVPLI